VVYAKGETPNKLVIALESEVVMDNNTFIEKGQMFGD
jgi:hypothetical protein